MGFWEEHCPSRHALDLVHRHAADCTDGHLGDQCCECGQMARHWSPPPPPFATTNTTNVQEAPREPGFDRAAGPQGRPDGRGRGELTPRQKARLGFLSWLWRRGELD